MSGLTWDALVAREPRLAALEAEMAAARPEVGNCKPGRPSWYGAFEPERSYKQRLMNLIGWSRGEDDVPPHPTLNHLDLFTCDDLKALGDWHDEHTADDRAANPDLYTSEAWDVAYHHLYDRYVR